MTALFERLDRATQASRRYEVFGRVTQVVGLVIESDGPNARIGDIVICWRQAKKYPPRSSDFVAIARF